MRKLNIKITPAIRKLSLVPRDKVTGRVMGSYGSVFKGQGLEFKDYREYTTSDDSSLIDWKASMRGNKLLIKTYEEERSLDVYILLDVSNSMIYGTIKQLKNEYAAELVISLSHAMLQEGDNVALGLFNDSIVKEIKFNRGAQQFYQIVSELINPKNYGGYYDLERCLKQITSYVPSRSMVVIVSDFIGLKGNWKEELRKLANKCEVIGLMVRDPVDSKLPKAKGAVTIQDPYSRKRLIIKDNVRLRYERNVKRQEEEVQEEFIKNKGDFLKLETDRSYAEQLIVFFMNRSKKWR